MSYNYSGTIAAGGVAQVLIPPDTTGQLSGYQIENTSAGILYIEDGVGMTAGLTSEQIPAGGTYTSPDFLKLSAGVTIYGASIGQSFYCKAY